MDLPLRTLQTLDWPRVLDALAARARTRHGAEAVASLSLLDDLDDITLAHDQVAEVLAVEADGSRIPVGAVSDLRLLVKRAARGEGLELAELRLAGLSLEALEMLQAWLRDHDELAPELAALSDGIQLDGEVVARLVESFDETGQFSEVTYPQLATLRRSIQSLKADIERTLQSLLQEEGLGDVLQDRFVTQRQDRYVLPIKSHAKRWDLGIVHGTSASGQTVYIEPHQVVSLSNRLKVAEGELAREVRRLIAALSSLLGQHRGPILAAMDVATGIDLACARAQLAMDLSATRPRVGTDGVVKLVSARHPVLLLNGVDVVANDLTLGAPQPALVLTGPNTGGKTVALKTLALCCLLVRAGCFVPAEEGSRVDIFDKVLADIGDTQTVQEGLSTFSGHVAVMRRMLDEARPGALLLLDEIAVGTDPAQGAALARAVLERLVERGARLVTTTHYAELKALPAVDDRFAVAAVVHDGGVPTYRLTPGLAGESHALVIAQGLGLAPSLVERARELMGQAARDLAQALGQVDDVRAQLERERSQLRAEREALAAEQDALRIREARVSDREDQLQAKATGAFQARLLAAEKAIGQVVAELQRAPSHQGIDQARQTLAALGGLAPAPEPEPEVAEPAQVQVGDTVRVRSLSKTGKVESVGGGGAQVRVGAMLLSLPLTDLEPMSGGRRKAPKRKKMSLPRLPPPEPTKRRGLDDAVRLPHNTLDLRGQRVEESLDAIESYLHQAAADGRLEVFVLHGHGTGALKQAVRQALRKMPLVKTFQPASADQGGDAYTVVGLSG